MWSLVNINEFQQQQQEACEKNWIFKINFSIFLFYGLVLKYAHKYYKQLGNSFLEFIDCFDSSVYDIVFIKSVVCRVIPHDWYWWIF